MKSYPRASAFLACALTVALAAPSAGQSSTSARTGYQRLLTQEESLTALNRAPSSLQVRKLIAAYEHFAGRHARTGYADNALWQAAQLATSLSRRTKSPGDQATAKRLLQFLVRAYPSSSLVSGARGTLHGLSKPTEAVAAGSPPHDVAVRKTNKAVTPAPAAAAPPPPVAVLRDVRRTTLPDLVRVTLELSREVAYREARLSEPDRLALVLDATSSSPSVSGSAFTYGGDFVRKIDVTADVASTRVSLDLEGAPHYSVFALYNPYRLVVDVYRQPGGATAVASASSVPTAVPPPLLEARSLPRSRVGGTVTLVAPVESRFPRETSPPAPMPVAPAANATGTFSLSRQLGLGVSRIVIDPGHGGHDPGALGPKVSEAELVLDVALRLERLLRKNPSFEVALTRRTNAFVPLERRTVIANRFGADLFLSIHANASRNTTARGVETYFLNFASSADAEAVAARENAASGRSMRDITDIVKAITLNNKVDESRELARVVQAALVKGARSDDQLIRDLGVKQAPFVVLVGANMPSVLAEISFITNPTDAQRLRTAASRQRIAESLAEAVFGYQRALKATETASLR